MLVVLKSRKIYEACRWTGENRLELEEFTDHEVEFTIYSSKPPVPEINRETVEIGDYIVRFEDGLKLLKRMDADKEYEIEKR